MGLESVSLVSGWEAAGDDSSRWTVGRRASIRFHVLPSSTDKILSIKILRVLPSTRFPVTAAIDGVVLGSQNMVNAGEYVFPIPGRVLAGKESFLLTLDTPAATSPKKLGLNEDTRVLGLLVNEVSIRDAVVDGATKTPPVASLTPKLSKRHSGSFLCHVEPASSGRILSLKVYLSLPRQVSQSSFESTAVSLEVGTWWSS
jgi:hypothetical protein